MRYRYLTRIEKKPNQKSENYFNYQTKIMRDHFTIAHLFTELHAIVHGRLAHLANTRRHLRKNTLHPNDIILLHQISVVETL